MGVGGRGREGKKGEGERGKMNRYIFYDPLVLCQFDSQCWDPIHIYLCSNQILSIFLQASYMIPPSISPETMYFPFGENDRHKTQFLCALLYISEEREVNQSKRHTCM